MELFGLAWIGAAIGAGAIANSKGRSAIGYFLLGLLLPLIGLLIAIGMAPAAPERVAPGAKRGTDLILCTTCGRPHRADAMACPGCGKSNLAPAEPTTKKCVACAETILAEAKKCKHCGEPQPEPATSAVPTGPRSNWAKADEIERTLDQRR